MRAAWAIAIATVALLGMGIGEPAVHWSCSAYPVRNLAAPDRDEASSTVLERWCRARFGSEEFIFDADPANPRAELAALIETDASGRMVAVTHGSLNQGRVTIHRSLMPEVDPLPIPIDPAREGAAGVPLRSEVPRAQSAAALRILAGFRAERVHAAIAPARLEEGEFESDLPDSAIPWRGYWWPMRGYPLARDDDSPLAKYDRAIQAIEGTDPGAVPWEIAHHDLSAAPWDGHCNGWAAAAILYPEPDVARVEPRTGIHFLVSDFKGLLTEASFCVPDAFYGHRYDGPWDDPSDIYPDEFHETLIYYIDGLRKPLAYDHERLEPVDNHLITGYHMVISRDGDVAGRFDVQVTLRSRRYDWYRREATGPAPEYDRDYEYTLDTDATGRITGGHWIGTNPDFLWAPVSNVPCAGVNPGVTPQRIQEIVEHSTPEDDGGDFPFSRPASP